ncbi:hypothetical protein [Olegusella massiliensis]|uniref:hypothetical protein n=1 Tax=Olegusella massiliensis TaxID=1776381 RepID=UPI00040D63E5|nr:hypothetical protein [Olegusella massiliensis]MBS5865475.1 hypothetical protein [Coriobacteriaceae bacterium]
MISKTAIKMLGLALMVVGVFAILFGTHLVGAACVAIGVIALLVGLVLYAVVRTD